MQINAAINLAFPIRTDDAGNAVLHAYHTPISREVFEASYRIIAATKAALFGKGLAYAADVGPRIAALALADAGRQIAAEGADPMVAGDAGDGGARSLLMEIRRLTMVLTPGPAGFDLLPIDAAVARGVIDADDWREAEAALVFFTCAFAMVPRAKRRAMAAFLASLLTASITSLPPTEYGDSLGTLTPTATSGAFHPSSVPS